MRPAPASRPMPLRDHLRSRTNGRRRRHSPGRPVESRRASSRNRKSPSSKIASTRVKSLKSDSLCGPVFIIRTQPNCDSVVPPKTSGTNDPETRRNPSVLRYGRARAPISSMRMRFSDCHSFLLGKGIRNRIRGREHPKPTRKANDFDRCLPRPRSSFPNRLPLHPPAWENKPRNRLLQELTKICCYSVTRNSETKFYKSIYR